MTNKRVDDICAEFEEKAQYGIDAEKGLEFAKDWLTKTLTQFQKDIVGEAHETKDGYCCACDYDIAVFEGKIQEARAEIVGDILAELPKPYVDGVQEGGIGTATNTEWCEGHNWLLDEVRAIITRFLTKE